MAIETETVKRDDIFTLFLTTRIINFIKGLSQNLSSRDKVGLFILRHLFLKRELLADTSQGYKKIKKFKPDLFFQVIEKIDQVMNLRGEPISLRKLAFLDNFPQENFLVLGDQDQVHL